MTPERISEWINTKSNLDAFKASESALKKEITFEMLAGEKGVKKEVVGPYEIKADAGISLTADGDAINKLWVNLTPEEKACIGFKPVIKAKLYNALPQDSLLRRECVTAKVKAATLTLISTEE